MAKPGGSGGGLVFAAGGRGPAKVQLDEQYEDFAEWVEAEIEKKVAERGATLPSLVAAYEEKYTARPAVSAYLMGEALRGLGYQYSAKLTLWEKFVEKRLRKNFKFYQISGFSSKPYIYV